MDIRTYLAKNYVNMRGWHTKRKIVVFESDDWGSIRTPSKDVYSYLLSKGVRVDNPFDMYDSLEAGADLEALFDVLCSVVDMNGRHAVLTPCNVVANPAFSKIESSNLQCYYAEPVLETYKNYVGSENVMDLYKEGIAKNIFVPQFHFREHINVKRWMKAINSGLKKEKYAFETKSVVAGEIDGDGYYPLNYFAACDYDDAEHRRQIELILEDGLRQFESLFGYVSDSFVPCCGICGTHLFPVLQKYGVNFLQCGQRYEPEGNGKLKLTNNFFGDKTPYGQIFWRRNCSFEPARKRYADEVDRCLQEINIAFTWHKPAIINSHRVNYIGRLSLQNRDNTLKQLRRLLGAIKKNWPNVEFMSSKDFARIIGK